MVVRMCKTARCPNTAVKGGRCIIHKREREAQTHSNKSIYNSKRWRVLRRRVLFEQPLCACGCGEIAEDVHHIVALEDGGAPYARSNVQGLTHACHSRETKREQQSRSV